MLGPFNNPGVDDSGFYVPFYSSVTGPALATPLVSQFATVVVKPRGGQRADALANALRREVNKADPNLPLYFVGTPRSQQDGFVAQNRIIAIMFSIFGIVAVVLASVGIYGVMSFSVNQRTQEFGVRMALGADQGRILGMVLKQGSIQVGLGPARRPGAGAGARHDRRERHSEHALRRQRARPARLRLRARRSWRSSRSSPRSSRRGARRASIR